MCLKRYLDILDEYFGQQMYKPLSSLIYKQLKTRRGTLMENE